jgi:hypothetical protein
VDEMINSFCRVFSVEIGHLIPPIARYLGWIEESTSALKAVDGTHFVFAELDVEETDVLRETLRLRGLD